MLDLANITSNESNKEFFDKKRVVYIGHGERVGVYYGIALFNQFIQIDKHNPRKSLYDQIKSYAGVPDNIDYSKVLIVSKIRSGKLKGELYVDNKELTFNHNFNIDITEKSLDELIKEMKDKIIITINNSYDSIRKYTEKLGYNVVDFT